MARVPSRGVDQFPLRLPDGMRDRIKAEAEKNGRSMNAEILFRIEESFEPKIDPADPDQSFLREMRKGWERIADAYRTGEQGAFLHIILDTNGNPASWSEVMENVERIARIANLDPHRIEVSVLDASVGGAFSDNQKQVLTLARNHNLQNTKPKDEDA